MGWTEHVALPQAEPEPEPEPEVVYLDVARAPRPTLADDGELHPRAKDVAFSGAPRGPVEPPAERLRLDKDRLLGFEGIQLAGAAALTVMFAWIAVTGILSIGDHGILGSMLIGTSAALCVAIPVAMRVVRRIQARTEFWAFWCASRGYEPGHATGPGKILPELLSRSPLLGPLEGRAFEFVARRTMLERRESIVGIELRTLDSGPGTQPGDAPASCRFAFVVMPMPEQAAHRWQGASIRGDHHSTRPIMLRAMLGPLLPASIPDCRVHLAAGAEQDPAMLQRLVDARLDRYIAAHPMDIDMAGELLVVTRDCDDPLHEEFLDDLCRDALLIHELLVAEHELPTQATPEESVAMPLDDEPVVDRTREGWGGGDAQYYEAA